MKGLLFGLLEKQGWKLKKKKKKNPEMALELMKYSESRKFS